jgi:hypothetical protein
MIDTPECFKRRCIHYTGVIQPDGTEQTEKPACKVFPNGIPDEIAFASPYTVTVFTRQLL